MAVALPTGTVTLLFSDIEASTKMVHTLGDAWAQVLELQRRLCRRAWERHHGIEMGTEGDSFFVVFASPRDAVAAGLRVQASIAAATWPQGARVRVRMGIHTGTPTRHDDGYVGMDLHRAARVAAAAHGGQLVVSEATMRLVEDALPGEVVTRDLGEHQLKDIPSRTRIFQLSLAGQDADFPPLRSLGGAGSLPTALRDGLREVVGREDDVAEVAALVTGGERLVTLTGPGGVGKSTLAGAVAVAVADHFGDGVFVAPLVGVGTAAGMWVAISQVLDVPPDGQVPPGFFDHLGRRRLLLVLDNLEQIADADHVVRELLAHTPHVAVVATSRRPLHLTGEREHAVGELALDDAVAMFARHAARARRGFAVDEANRPAVEALCTALDRLPLALEIAAARVKLLSPQAILGRIDRSLDLASGDRGRDDRQATIRGAIAWSYDLLDPVRRAVLDHLGVFLGGASIEALEAVVPDAALEGADLLDVLFDLVDHSMVVVTDTADGEPRFHLLETVRRFALDRLAASGALPAAEQRHAEAHLGLVRRLLAAAHVRDYRPSRVTFLLEQPNVDAMVSRPGVAPDWDGEPVPRAHLAALTSDLALRFRLVEDARQWCTTALADAAPDPLGRAWLTACLAQVEAFGDTTRAVALATSAVELVTVLDPGAARPWRNPVQVAVQAAYYAGWSAADRGDTEDAEGWSARLRDLTAGTDDPVAAAMTAELGAMLANYGGEVQRSWDLQVEAERHRLAAGFGVDLHTVNNLADLELQLDRPDLAWARLARHLPQLLDLGDPLLMAIYTETMGAAIGHQHPLLCARAYASVSVFRVVEGLGNDEYGRAEDERVLAAVRPLVDAADWDRAWEQGLGETLTDLLAEMATAEVRAGAEAG